MGGFGAQSLSCLCRCFSFSVDYESSNLKRFAQNTNDLKIYLFCGKKYLQLYCPLFISKFYRIFYI
jgi:hypothetical protein